MLFAYTSCLIGLRMEIDTEIDDVQEELCRPGAKGENVISHTFRFLDDDEKHLYTEQQPWEKPDKGGVLSLQLSGGRTFILVPKVPQFNLWSF